MLDLTNAAKNLKNVSSDVLNQAWDIVDTEGGWSDDNADAGGATNYGISLKFAEAQTYVGSDGETYKTFDLNNDGVVNAEDIKEVTPEMAVATYILDFFMSCGLNNLPNFLQSVAFDTSVNGGPNKAVRLLQSCINKLNVVPTLKVDGQFGAKTNIACRQAAELVSKETFVNTYCNLRVEDYKSIAANNENDEKFLTGWLNRANKFRIDENT